MDELPQFNTNIFIGCYFLGVKGVNEVKGVKDKCLTNYLLGVCY